MGSTEMANKLMDMLQNDYRLGYLAVSLGYFDTLMSCSGSSTSSELSEEEQGKGYRLACQAVVKSDLVVRIPVESAIDSSVLKLQSAPRRTAHIREMNFEELKEKGLFI